MYLVSVYYYLSHVFGLCLLLFEPCIWSLFIIISAMYLISVYYYLSHVFGLCLLLHEPCIWSLFIIIWAI